MFIFLVLSILYLAGWSVMFFSTTFRWTFVTWSFFSVMACASVFLTVLSFILGVVCRYNFGKGLPRYRAYLNILISFAYYNFFEQSTPKNLKEMITDTTAVLISKRSISRQTKNLSPPTLQLSGLDPKFLLRAKSLLRAWDLDSLTTQGLIRLCPFHTLQLLWSGPLPMGRMVAVDFPVATLAPVTEALPVWPTIITTRQPIAITLGATVSSRANQNAG